MVDVDVLELALPPAFDEGTAQRDRAARERSGGDGLARAYVPDGGLDVDELRPPAVRASPLPLPPVSRHRITGTAAGGSNENGRPAGAGRPFEVGIEPELRLEDRVQILRGQRLAELLQGSRLELPDPLARQAERLADLLEGVLLLAAQAVAQAQDQLLARRSAIRSA